VARGGGFDLSIWAKKKDRGVQKWHRGASSARAGAFIAAIRQFALDISEKQDHLIGAQRSRRA